MKRLDVYLLLTPDTEAYVQNMGRETHEMLAFVRGLPQREYDIGVHGLRTVSETVKRHRLSSAHFPLLVLDGNILSSGHELKPDDLSDLLRLGCEYVPNECPAVYPFAVRYLRWLFDDPTVETGMEDERMRVFRRVRDEIRGKIKRWLEKEQGTVGED